MSALSLHIDGLESEPIRYAAPLCKDGSLDPARVEAALRSWTAETPQGPIHSGYRRQVLSREGLKESMELAHELQKSFDTMVVLGIGGSALGARTALSALTWRIPTSARRRVIVIDNLDPAEFNETLSRIDLKRTCVTVVTKTGGTIETMAQASVFMELLGKAGLDLRKHMVVVTDPKSGALREWATREKIPALAVPPDVGGRFSVMTPVGILPLAFAGIDVDALVRGAVSQLGGNMIPLPEIARLGSRLAQLELAGFTGHVLMPYATLLKDFGAWFVQLWGESLGKHRSQGGERGSLPVAAVGATDQHSLLQMLVEGPNRLVTGFLRIEEWASPNQSAPRMAPLPGEFSSLAFAKGRLFSEILNAEAEATERVLKQGGRPTYRLAMARPDPACLGALFSFYMDLTVCTAAALEVNPFDQPGVELGKKILPGILGT